MKIKKAVIPAAGFGTRFLPATKVMPKEMITVVDKPAIQYVVEEAVNSGIEEILIIVSRNKEIIMDHFDDTPELDQFLSKKNDIKSLKISQDLSKISKISYIRQHEAKGLGNAISYAKEFVGNEPFVVLLPDDIIESEKPVTLQLIESYNRNSGTILGVQQVNKKDLSKYGIIDGNKLDNGDFLVKGMVEKPDVEDAPSDYAILGRYILSNNIFDAIDKTFPGKGGEIQLTDAISLLSEKENIYASVFEGNRYDVGNKLGYLKATVNLALKHPEVKDEFETFLKNL